jgi:ParB family chromosome partitioning protein
MLSSLRKENFAKFGFNAQTRLTDEEKAGAIASLTDEQKDVIRRDFIVKHLSDTSGDSKQSHLLLEFAELHFPDKVKQIKEQYNEVYKKRHIRIEERIRELQPFTDKQEPEKIAIAESVVLNEEQPETVETSVEETPDPGTFDDPDMDDIPLYPGLPEQARIGEIPEGEEELFDTVCEEMAA